MRLWHGVLGVVCAVVRVVREHVYQMPLGCSSPGAADVPCRFVWVSGMALPIGNGKQGVCGQHGRVHYLCGSHLQQHCDSAGRAVLRLAGVLGWGCVLGC